MALLREGESTQSARVLDAVLEALFDAVFAYRLDDGRITAWNRAAERIYGWSAADALGRRPADLIGPGPDPSPGSLLRHSYREREVVHSRRDGRPVTVRARWALESDAAGTPLGVIAIHRDVTEQRAQERERAEFLNLTAHELRSPLTVIAGYLSMIEEGSLPLPDDPQADIIGVMRTKAAELSDLVERMVDAAKQPQRPSPGRPGGPSS